MTNSGDANELAAIEYHGIAGATQDCVDAVIRLLQFGDGITRTRILSCSSEHCLLLTVTVGDLIAIKSGFASGYRGEGPRGFSLVLELLRVHGSEIKECEVPSDLIERLDSSALTVADVEYINAAKPVRPSRLTDYVLQEDAERALKGTLWADFPPVIPFAVIDNRIIDLALSFWESPDDRLLKGYRRLEDLVRKRTGVNERGAKLFSQAFGGITPLLSWRNITDGERTGRINLFTGAYMAHRNPRAHQELKGYPDGLLTEFLVLNHLYRLERDSEEGSSVAVGTAQIGVPSLHSSST